MGDTNIDDHLSTQLIPEVLTKTFDGKQLSAQETRLLQQPIKYQIYKLKELQKAKSQNIAKQNPETKNLNKLTEERRATTIYPKQTLSEIQYFKPISLKRELKSVENIFDTTYIDKHWQFNEQVDTLK